MTWDILIHRGTLIDGSGSPGMLGDVAVKVGRIAALGPTLAGNADKVIDASGLAVTPGFIDIKTHSDFVLPINPKAESKVRQGVTTEIIGHCGFSVAPVLPGKAELLADYLSGGAPWLPFREMCFPEYLDTFPAVAVNTGMLVGHNTLRLMVMGLEDRSPTKTELGEMIALLEDGLRAGALGMSSGLFTPPGSFAQADEIIALCAVLKRHNAGYFTHIRDESNKVVEAVEEAIEIARACGVRRRRHSHHRALADGARRFGRKLRRDLWHRQPRHAASALLRYLSENYRALRPRRTGTPARAGDLQDDRWTGEGAQIQRPRTIEGGLSRRHCDF